MSSEEKSGLDKHLGEALDIMSSVPLIDGHNDWVHLIRGYYDNKLDERFHPEKSLAGHVDLKRLVAGKAGAVFWSVYVDCPEDDDFTDDSAHFGILRDTMQQIDLAHRLIDLYSEKLEMAENSTDVMRIFRAGKCASLLGAEGLHQICNSSSVLRMLHRLGVRYITLAHAKNNVYADSATSSKPAHHGLSDAGRAVIREMNRVGLIVDLSHTSEAVMLDTLECCTAPVIFSHSSAYGLVPHPRNVPDRVLDKLKENNGVLMVSFIPHLTHRDPSEATVDHLVDHVVYVGERIGYEHVGLGSDFDGMVSAVRGVEDVSKYPNLVASMLARGIARPDVEKVVGRNVIRVLHDVEKVAEKARLAKMPPLEDKVKQLWSDKLREFAASQYPNAERFYAQTC